MSYPNSEVRKAQNGYIIQQGRNEYVFDNFLEMMVVLAEQYEEKSAVFNCLTYCKENSANYQNPNEDHEVPD